MNYDHKRQNNDPITIVTINIVNNIDTWTYCRYIRLILTIHCGHKSMVNSQCIANKVVIILQLVYNLWPEIEFYGRILDTDGHHYS